MEDGLPVGHLEGPELRLNAVLSPDSIVHDLDVQLSHPAQDGLRTENISGLWTSVEAAPAERTPPPLPGPSRGPP